MVAWLWILAAGAGEPTNVRVDYTVRFDLGDLGDKACSLTGICDCSLTYRGEGTVLRRAGGTTVFEGTWKHTDGQCTDAFLLWAPSNGVAFHHLTVSDGKVTEWMVSRGSSDKRLSSGMKAGGQFWITGMAATIDAGSGAATHREEEASRGGGVSMSTSHELQLVLSGG